jgi:hypothetical protein
MGTVRWYRRGTSLLWVRRSTAERPSPLRVCSYLNQNALTGSVPSSLSALTKLESLCVPPSCQRHLYVRLMLGRIGRLCSECARHVGGCMSGASSGGGAARAVAVLSEGTLGTRCDYGVLKGHPPPMGTVRGYRRGTWLLWVRHSTAERPSPLRVCSDLSVNTLTGSVPSSLSALTKLESLCVPPSCQWRLGTCG